MSESGPATEQTVQHHLETFARTISQGPLGLAYYRPQAWAETTRCFENARRQAAEHGGRALFGWMFHHRVVADLPGPGYLIAVHHAVWHAPTGRLEDVTPIHQDPKHHPITPGGDVLFLVDTEARPVVSGQRVAPKPSRFYALSADAALIAHVDGLQAAEDAACHALYAEGP
jgi:hypothetical protein